MTLQKRKSATRNLCMHYVMFLLNAACRWQ